MFGSTSGTTSQPKWVPVTHTWRRKVAGLMRFWIGRASLAHPGMLNGKVLTMVSPAVEAETSSGFPIGSVSGWASSRVPWIIRRRYAVPYEVSTIDAYDLRYYLTARFAFEVSVSVAAAELGLMDTEPISGGVLITVTVFESTGAPDS